MTKATVFTILDDQSATFEQMVTAAAECVTLKEAAERLFSEARKKRIALKERVLAGEKCQNEYDAAKSELDEAEIEIEAYSNALKRITAALETRLPMEIKGRIAEIHSQQRALKETNREILRQVLVHAARAVAARERWLRRDVTLEQNFSTGTTRLRKNFPTILVRPDTAMGYGGVGDHTDIYLKDDDRQFFIAEIAKARIEQGLNEKSKPTEAISDALLKEEQDLKLLLGKDVKETIAAKINQARKIFLNGGDKKASCAAKYDEQPAGGAV